MIPVSLLLLLCYWKLKTVYGGYFCKYVAVFDAVHHFDVDHGAVHDVVYDAPPYTYTLGRDGPIGNLTHPPNCYGIPNMCSWTLPTTDCSKFNGRIKFISAPPKICGCGSRL